MNPTTVPLDFQRRPAEDSQHAAAAFCDHLATRRTVRDFSPDAIPPGVLEDCLRTAGSAPSGANLQPWHFAVVRAPRLKAAIREAAEAEDRQFYAGRAPDDWLETLAPLGTNADKPYLETAPALVVVFQANSVPAPDGEPRKTYYPKESVGIATGFLIAALHNAGLATLTHTPSPMGFLNTLLDRPSSEKPFLLLVVGYPAGNCRVPAITRKPLAQTCTFYDAPSQSG